VGSELERLDEAEGEVIMAEKSVFVSGNPGVKPNQKLSEADVSSSKDAYGNGYKDPAQTLSEQEKFGTNLNPVKNPPMPAKGLRGVGG
jgi:hypothetical protein